MVRNPCRQHQQNVKTSPGPPRGVMVPLVLLVHPDPPWSTFSVKFQKVWIRMDRSGPGGPQGSQPPLVDQERSGPPWTRLRHFPDEDWEASQNLPVSTINWDPIKRSVLQGRKKEFEYVLRCVGVHLSLVLICFGGL